MTYMCTLANIYRRLILSDVIYTREVESDAIASSSVVDEVCYNENTGDLYVDLHPGDVYKYSNVPVSVVDEFEAASSAGSFYATRIKRDYGPGENLGNWRNLDYDFVEVEKPKVAFQTGGLVTNFTLNTDGSLYANVKPGEKVLPPTETVNTINTTFSLKPFNERAAVKVEGIEREYIVTFEVEGIVEFKRHTLRSTSVDAAVESVLNLGKMLDLNFVVREVTIRFE